jgi:nucleoside-diphosphate-sugar epimerase
MEYVILRPSVVYGPRDDRLSKLFRTAVKGRFPLFGRGDGRRHMVYVTDVAANTEMIIAGPEAVPLREMLQILARLTQRRSCGPQLPLAPMLGLAAVVEDVCKLLKIKPPIYRRRMDFYLSDAAFNCARARQVLGWEPKVSLTEGLDHTLKAYQFENIPRLLA